MVNIIVKGSGANVNSIVITRYGVVFSRVVVGVQKDMQTIFLVVGEDIILDGIVIAGKQTQSVVVVPAGIIRDIAVVA